MYYIIIRSYYIILYPYMYHADSTVVGAVYVGMVLYNYIIM